MSRTHTARSRVDVWLVAVVAGAAIVYAAIAPRVFERLDPMTGDEPFYVMTAISPIRDGDLDETNNYARRDYDAFYRGPPLPEGWRGWTRLAPALSPHLAVTSREGQYTKHGLGLPLLIAAPFELFGRFGAVAVIAICAVALAGQMYLLAREVAGPGLLAAAVALALATVMPIVPYSLLLFPEVPAALLLVYAVRRAAAERNSTLRCIAAGCAIGFLPWLHQRFVPTAFVLTLVLVHHWWTGRRDRASLAAFASIALGGVSLVLFNFWLYGSPIQPPKNHDGFNSIAGSVNGAFGLLLDAQWGLWTVAPLMILALAATPHWRAASPRTFPVAALALAPYLFVLAIYSVWWGSWGPPARYLVPLVPFAAGSLAAWLVRASRAGRVVAAAFWCAGCVLTLIGLRDPQRFYHQPDGDNHLVRRLGDWLDIDLAGRLVAFQTFDPSPLRERVVASVAGLSLLLICVVLMWILPSVRSTARPTARSTRVASPLERERPILRPGREP